MAIQIGTRRGWQILVWLDDGWTEETFPSIDHLRWGVFHTRATILFEWATVVTSGRVLSLAWWSAIARQVTYVKTVEAEIQVWETLIRIILFSELISVYGIPLFAWIKYYFVERKIGGLAGAYQKYYHELPGFEFDAKSKGFDEFTLYQH